jgi:hypothetical protein
MMFDMGFLFAKPALYLDPGSGSFLIQLLLAAALGIGVATRMYWAKIKSLFGGKKAEPPAETAEENDEE